MLTDFCYLCVRTEFKMIIWNPWHGCHKVSEGCRHCYMYFLDGKRGVDTSQVFRTGNFDLPVRRGRDGQYKIASGMRLFVGLSTDFFVEEADRWRDKAWEIIRRRPDVVFRILTKRASRIRECLPDDWGDGYENVLLQVTTENQIRADERLPILLDIPARHKGFMAAPLIGPVDASKYLVSGQIDEVTCGGENYDGARPCRYEWVKSLSDQCRKYDVKFTFIETGTVFVKDGKTYHIPDKQTQSRQAGLSGLSHDGKTIHYSLRLPESSLFGGPIPEPEPHFRKACDGCGSRPICNGCGECGACEKKASEYVASHPGTSPLKSQGTSPVKSKGTKPASAGRMKIEEAILYVLAERSGGLRTEQIAEIINRRRLHVRKDGQPVTSAQVYAVVMRFPDTFVKAEGRIMLMI